MAQLGTAVVLLRSRPAESIAYAWAHEMAKLIYSAIASVDGYTADEQGNFGWAEPDEEVHAFINDLERSVGTYLYGRRMYKTMAGWETDATLAAQSVLMREFAEIRQKAEKVVYLKTLKTAPTRRTRIERDFESRGHPTHENFGRAGPHGGRPRPRCARVQSRVGR